MWPHSVIWPCLVDAAQSWSKYASPKLSGWICSLSADASSTRWAGLRALATRSASSAWNSPDRLAIAADAVLASSLTEVSVSFSFEGLVEKWEQVEREKIGNAELRRRMSEEETSPLILNTIQLTEVVMVSRGATDLNVHLLAKPARPSVTTSNRPQNEKQLAA